MKLLTERRRARVRDLVRSADALLCQAEPLVANAYGSHWARRNLQWAMRGLRDVEAEIPKMAPPPSPRLARMEEAER